MKETTLLHVQKSAKTICILGLFLITLVCCFCNILLFNLGTSSYFFYCILVSFFFFMDFHRIAKRFHSYTTAVFCENSGTVWYSNVVLFVNTLELTADAIFNTIIH